MSLSQTLGSFFSLTAGQAQDLQTSRVQLNNCGQPKSSLLCPLKLNEKYTETELGGNRKVAFILNWWREDPSRLMPQELFSPSVRSLGAYISQGSQSGVSDEVEFFLLHCFKDSHKLPSVTQELSPVVRWLCGLHFWYVSTRRRVL